VTARVDSLVALRCDDPCGCDETWIGGVGAPLERVRAEAVAAGWLWADDRWTAGELHWCPGPHEGKP
jgi:hypothetical protein